MPTARTITTTTIPTIIPTLRMEPPETKAEKYSLLQILLYGRCGSDKDSTTVRKTKGRRPDTTPRCLDRGCRQRVGCCYHFFYRCNGRDVASYVSTTHHSRSTRRLVTIARQHPSSAERTQPAAPGSHERFD